AERRSTDRNYTAGPVRCIGWLSRRPHCRSFGEEPKVGVSFLDLPHPAPELCREAVNAFLRVEFGRPRMRRGKIGRERFYLVGGEVAVVRPFGFHLTPEERTPAAHELEGFDARRRQERLHYLEVVLVSADLPVTPVDHGGLSVNTARVRQPRYEQ